MAIENLTQRGANTGAQMDAVAAFAFQVSYEALSDREASRNHEAFPNKRALEMMRTTILKDGPGEASIYRAINGFDRREATARKAEDDKAEMITQHAVRNAIAEQPLGRSAAPSVHRFRHWRRLPPWVDVVAKCGQPADLDREDVFHRVDQGAEGIKGVHLGLAQARPCHALDDQGGRMEQRTAPVDLIDAVDQPVFEWLDGGKICVGHGELSLRCGKSPG
jgi:hypothetical protein